MSNATDTMKSYIPTNLNRAIELALQPTNEHDAEGFVYAALNYEPAIPELIDAALQGCFNLHEKMGKWSHGTWVHSMSHFMTKLWDRRLTEWIKRFHEVSFKGAKEWNETSCSDRLVGYFAEKARFDDDPADFFLTEENLSWMTWRSDGYAKARMEHGVLGSENELKLFKLLWVLRNHSFVNWEDVVDVSSIEATLKEAAKLGGDVSEFDGIISRELNNSLVKLREKIETTKSYDPKYWSEENKAIKIAEINQMIAKAQAELDAIQTN